MPYVTSIERLGRQEGLQEGRVQALRESILDTLEARFGQVPEALLEQLQELHAEPTLKRLHRQAVLVASLAEFTRGLAV